MTAPIPIADELLTEAEVIRRIPGRDADVRAWLHIPRCTPPGACYCEVLHRARCDAGTWTSR